MKMFSGENVNSPNHGMKILRIFLSHYSLSSTLLIVAIGLIQIFIFEKIDANDGLGYDGIIYAQIVYDTPGAIFSRDISSYYKARIFPSIMVHYLMKVFRLQFNTTGIARGFAFFNLLVLITGAILWGRIAEHAQMRMSTKWLGFILLFSNFALLKMPYYYASLVDTTAFTLGMALLYAYLKNFPGLLLLTTIMGLFTWPTLFYNAAILYILPRQNGMPPLRAGKQRWPYLIGGVACIFIGAIIVRYFLVIGIKRAGWGSQVIIPYLLPLSIIILFVYVTITLNSLFCNTGISTIFAQLKRVSLLRVLIMGALYQAFNLFVQQFSIADNMLGLQQLAITIVLSSIIYPGIFLIAHTAYFGQVIILSLLFYKECTKFVHSYGLGMILVVALNSMLLIFSESRCLIIYLPFMVFISAGVLDTKVISKRMYAVVIGLSVFVSKIWLPIGIHSGLYFMNFGPWMSRKYYLVQGMVMLLLFLVTRSFFKNALQLSIGVGPKPTGTIPNT